MDINNEHNKEESDKGAEENISMKSKLLAEYEEWAILNSDLITLASDGVCEDGRIYLKFNMGKGKTFTLFCPSNYPNQEENFFVEATPTLQLWCNTINEFILDSDSLLTLETILYKAAALFCKNVKKSPCDSSSDSEIDGEEDMMLGEESDEEWEYTLSQKKKQWRLKEAQLRAETNQPKTSDMFEGCVKDHPKQVFSNSGASGILTNDLVGIIKTSKQTGIRAEAVDDNIYRWYVFLSSFDIEGPLHEDLLQLQNKYGYNYIQLQLDFTMDLYPFYPPVVKVVRPRLQGSMMLRVASLLKLSCWNPARDMKSVLVEIKEYLNKWARLDTSSERNDIVRFPHGSYLDIENYLLWLACVSEIPPRASARYPDIAQESSISTTNCEQKKKTGKSMFPAGTGFSSDSHTGWDVNAFLAAQREKDKQVERVLKKILLELKTGCHTVSDEKVSWCSKPYSDNTIYSSFFSSSAVTKEEKLEDKEKKNLSTKAHLYENHTNGRDSNIEKMTINNDVENTSQHNGTISSSVEDLYSVLEPSTLVPFLERKLQVDSFLEICQHTSVYLCVVDIIREIARYPELVPLLWVLPDQQQSIYGLVHRLEDQAKCILTRVGKTSANGNIPKSEKTLSDMSKSSTSSEQQSEDEKLARDFYEMSQAVTSALQDAGLLAGGPQSEMASLLPDASQAYTKSLGQSYKEALKDLQFLSCDIEVEGASAHHYSTDFKMALPPNSAQVMRIAQEMAALSTALPLDLESAIFIRTDDAKCTLLRALIIGPEGTPYSGGCFQFDIFFPPRYPSSPPLVHFCTTGLGLVRFNPNLYASGTVCLSLLGTWKGLQGEHWNQTSTLLQVLVSIQSLILVPEPFFNEPGYESMLGTREGSQNSKAYNKDILLHTIRHAMVSQLRRPSSGFEEVIQTHFRIKKDRILQEIKSQMEKDCSYELSKAYETLRTELELLSSSQCSKKMANEP